MYKGNKESLMLSLSGHTVLPNAQCVLAAWWTTTQQLLREDWPERGVCGTEHFPLARHGTVCGLFCNFWS